jgi:hypothetical protein
VSAKKSIRWQLRFPGDLSATHNIAKAFLTLSLIQSGEILGAALGVFL